MKERQRFAARRKIISGAVVFIFAAGLAAAMEACKFTVDPRFVYGALAAEIILAALSAVGLALIVRRLRGRISCGQYRGAALAFGRRAGRACRRGRYTFQASAAVFAACFMAVAGLFFTCTNISAAAVTDEKDFVRVIHAGGGGYLNSYELTLENARQGCEYIELDFLFTEDGYLVCSHYFEFCGHSFEDRATLEEFMESDLGGYTPMTADMLMQLMAEETGFKVVFDTKEDDIFSVIAALDETAANYGVDIYSRFIIQFYDKADYDGLADMPFEELWFTNYRAKYDTLTIERYFGDDDRVTTIVMNETDWMIKASFARVSGKQIAVHTINDLSLAEFYAARGVDFIYCDYII